LGVIPHLLPNVAIVSLNPHELDTTEFNHCFGIPDPFPGFLAIGFSCMTVLKTTFVPVWAVLGILTLHTLHIDLSDDRFWYETEEFGAGWYEIEPASPAITSST
jgi:hypothetical protein